MSESVIRRRRWARHWCMWRRPMPDCASLIRPAFLALFARGRRRTGPRLGSSDSVHTRAAGIPTFGLCSIFYDLDDDRMHAADERIGIAA
jgi:acetylornithine deacetylase/succinyl-diaminopimelate desuccinylase-like protein